MTAEILEVARRVAATAGAGEQVEAYVARSRSTKAVAQGGELESFTSAETAGVGIRVVQAHRQGFAWAASLDDDVVRSTLADARDNARYAEPDEFAGIAAPDGHAVAALDLWRPGVSSLAAEAKIALALALERAVVDGDTRVSGVRSASYGDNDHVGAICTSAGIEVTSGATSSWLSVLALATDGAATQTGAGVDVARDPADLDIERAAHDAVERATRLLGATKAASQRLTIVLEPRSAISVFAVAASMFTGDVVLKRRSPFADRLGEVIASPVLGMVDDPTDARSLAAAGPHDGEGLATRANVVVEAGRLCRFLHDSTTGRRAGSGSTASAVRGVRSTPTPGVQALAVAPGRATLADLVAGVERGVLVQALHGVHSGTNRVSGDFSVGIDGVAIRDGALAEPVREVTIASTIPRLLLDIRAVGADIEWLPSGAGAPAVVIDDVQLSGR
ncbi:MAG: TldD/PmbA family protein [Acidimicrobiia bacterium]